jgi:filamentous hemagglutinin family protein
VADFQEWYGILSEIQDTLPVLEIAMLFRRSRSFTAIALILAANLAGILPVRADSIAPDRGSTGTRVNRNGNRYTITGGRRSPDGGNLFHSFEELGLNQGEIANFLSSPDIQNILGRVTGGAPSIIDGLLQVSGGNSNLYLMNPAGVVFGPNARLDVPAAFTATTATGIGFANGWFSAVGEPDYTALIGDPTVLAFDLSQPGVIINAGELTVEVGQDLALLGGVVVNTGTISAPGGSITIASVPGESLLRISQVGAALSLEVPATSVPGTDAWNLPVASLPQLLTGGSLSAATGLVANPDGSVTLTSTGSRIEAAPGTTLGSGRLDTSQPLFGFAPEITVLGDRIALVNAHLDASSLGGGGTIRIGGDQQGRGSLFTAAQAVVDGGTTLTADALGSGNGGRIILWADDTTQFAGAIAARGGTQAGSGGFVEVSGGTALEFRGNVDLTAENGTTGTLLLDPEIITIVDGAGASEDAQISDGTIFGDEEPGLTYTISEQALESLAGSTNVVLQASNTIVLEDLTDNELTFAVGKGSISFNAGQLFTMNPEDTINTQGRDISIRADTIVAGRITTFLNARQDFFSFDGVVLSDDERFPRASGDVTLIAAADVQVERIFGANVTLISEGGNIFTGSISSEADTVPAPDAVQPDGEVLDRDGNLVAPTDNLDNTNNQGEGSSIVIQAPQGTVELEGYARAGNTNKLTDSTINIEAQRFRAFAPLTIWENDATGEQVNPDAGPQVPSSLYVYGRDTDPPSRNSTEPRLGAVGRVSVQFGDDLPQMLGDSGETLVIIRILGDRAFAIAQPLALDSSGLTGAIGIGGRRDPSVNPIFRDVGFTALQPPPAAPPVAPPGTPAPISPPTPAPVPPTPGEPSPGVIDNPITSFSPPQVDDPQLDPDLAHVLDCRPDEDPTTLSQITEENLLDLTAVLPAELRRGDEDDPRTLQGCIE